MRDLKLGNATVDASFKQSDVRIIQDKTPVVTGNLQRSFYVDEDGNISSLVDYAATVELGTATRPGHFMVLRSAQEIGEALVDRIVDQLSNEKLIPDIIVNIELK